MKSLIRKVHSYIFIIIFTILSTNALAAVTQWVKITSDSNINHVYFGLDVEDMEASFIDCGYSCRLVKLHTTPFSSDGTLVIKLSNHCYGERPVRLPFSIIDGFLTTSLTTYYKTLGSEYCGFQDVSVVVTGDPRLETGYSINIISK